MKRLPLLAAAILLALVAWTFTGRISPAKKSAVDLPAQSGPAENVPNADVDTHETRVSPGTPETGRIAENSGRILEQRGIPITDLIQRRRMPIDRNFVLNLATGPDDLSFPLPDGRLAAGVLERRFFDEAGNPNGVEGRISKPSEGRFRFRIQPENDLAGPVTGTIVMRREVVAYRVDGGAGGKAFLTEYPKGEVVCLMPQSDAADPEIPEEIPLDHPIDIAIPAYQNGIVPLQSLPGNTAVLYLDFDGQKGPHEGWGDFDATAPNVTNTQVRAVWIRVAEDFAPFKLNVTTDLKVFLDAPENSRQRCIITPTTTASPGAGGVAFVNSFNSIGDTPCWAFYSTGKSSAEVVSHELGHTLGLSHDGRISPEETYYRGHGTDPVGWAPIMGSAYNKNLSQWSKGEYTSANQTQDDLNIIVTRNNNVTYRTDDAGSGHATAALLEIFGNGTVDTEGIIGGSTDVDAFRFSTTGGALNLTAAPVASGPNLDISFSLHDASGNQIATANPDLLLNATINATLPAGEYTVRVDGVGRGNALETGYSDYGSLGQYMITGTINGAVGPSRFALSENSAAGRVIGTPALRNSHGNSSINWSITAGNTGTAFTINPATGQITVANPGVLDFEALGGNWVKPPTFELTVSAMDSGSPALSETLRVVIQITDVNEAPVISSTPINVLSRTVPGIKLGEVQVTDPDTFDVPSFSIISGNTGGKFAIDSLGQIISSGSWATMAASYQLTIRVTDQGSPALTADTILNVTVIQIAEGYTPGIVYRTMYEGITGSAVSALTSASIYPYSPTREINISDFTDVTRGNNYGSTIRNWLIAPRTGTYRFWISGDDSTELYFNTAGNAASATRIAYRTSSTGYRNFTASTTQQSATFNLTAGQVCYIEARQKEGTGGDHVSVAWEIKNSSGSETFVAREVIPGRYLSRHLLNYAPIVANISAPVYRNTYQGATVARPVAADMNPGESVSWSISGGNNPGIFGIDPVTGRLFIANANALAATTGNSMTLTLSIRDNGTPPRTTTATFTANLFAPDAISTNGIIQEFWDNVSGTALTSLYSLPRYQAGRPDRLVKLAAFDSGEDRGDNYGSRIRVLFNPPTTGNYRFYISADYNAELRFSPSTNPATAVQIASVSAASGYLSFTEKASQTSTERSLIAGQEVYLDATVKESTGDDHLAVAWTGPGVTVPEVLTDDDTDPFDSNIAPSFTASNYRFEPANHSSSGTLIGTVSATDAPFEDLAYAILSGNEDGHFEIDPLTGAIRLSGSGSLSNGGTYTLIVGAQDSGHGRNFALREARTTVTISIPGIIAANEIVVWRDGIHRFESLTINGTLRLADSASLEVSGTFINRGILDLINWDGTLPPGFVNEGIILDRSLVKVLSSRKDGEQFSLTIAGYPGHFYQLQFSENLSGAWTNSGLPVNGSGTASAPATLSFSPPPSSPSRGFYRVVVNLD